MDTSVQEFAKSIVANAISSGEGWPDDAVFKVRKVILNCGKPDKVAHWHLDKTWFFESREEAEKLWGSLSDGMFYSNYQARITMEEWDLGPTLIRDYSLTPTTQINNL
jgi:hypothetical protein